MEEFYTFGEQSMIDYFNMQPSEVKGRFNAATEFHRRYLYNKIYSVFEFELPKDWEMNYFRFWLFHYGSIASIYTTEYGWIISPYGIEKTGLYFNPKVINVSNRFLKKSKTGVIGYNAEIIRCFDDYYGFDDIVNRYAEMLAEIDKDFNINLMNCNVSALFEVESKKQADEIKEAYGKATSGMPMVTINGKVLNGKSSTTLFPNVKQNYIGDELLTARRRVINEFLTEIGIRNANYDKKERLNSAEVNENNDETRAIVSIVFDNLTESFRRLNKISGLGLKVRLRYNYNEEVDEYAETDLMGHE